MASPYSTQFLSLPRCRWHSKWPLFPSTSFLQLQNAVLYDRRSLVAVSKRQAAESITRRASEGELVAAEEKTSRTSNRTPARRRKKVALDGPEDGHATDEETSKGSSSCEGSKKTRRSTRRRAEANSSELAEDKVAKKVTRWRKTKKKVDNTEAGGSAVGLGDQEGDSFILSMEDASAEELELGKGEEDDISFSYGWPPLVCCYGAAQHAFVPSGRPANRLINYEMHERMKDAYWTPEKFVRAPGGCASSVAVALASLGGKVAFMGKIGDDDYGQSLLYYLNMNNVQTRSVRMDSKKGTAISQMKIGKRGGLRMISVKPAAEDSLSRSEINIDVLREAKMFYFNTFSLLDQNMKSTTLQAIKISKKLGGVIFYDVNLPLPLWQSFEETKSFIQQAWNLAEVIEVTKQELEFLCGIKPSENFDTKDNDRSKFVHYEPELFSHLWHENLKVLFMTNGTSKIHYYTKEHNGAVLGMEDAPLSPFSRDMSASGDGIVAALMRMLTVQPHLINDKGYLEQSVKYAISCGVIDQWLLTRIRGFPPKECMEENAEPDPNGIRSVTEKEYRTLVPVS